VQNEDVRPKPRLNNESLQATTKLAIDMLPSPDSKSLLYFVGCLPAGVTIEQLNEMWGAAKVDNDLEMLLKLNLIERTENKRTPDFRYELNPVLQQFISQDIEGDAHEQFMRQIILYYLTQVKDFYKDVAFKEEDYGDAETTNEANPAD